MLRRRFSLVPALAAALLVAATARADDWPTYQHDPQHTGRSSASYDPTTLIKAWSAPQGYSTPTVVGDSVYAMRNQQGVGNDVTSVSSFRLSDGAVNWTYQSKFVFPSQPTSDNGLVVFSGTNQTTNATSLYVLDATNGNLRYTVPLSGIGLGAVMPTVAPNANGQLVAYVADGGSINAVNLGARSGSVLWTGTGSFGGQSIPTLAGNSVVLAGPGQFYAFDQVTGSANHFFSGSISGGGGTTVAYNSARGLLYVDESVGSGAGQFNALTAFSYLNNSNISQIWQRSGSGAVAGSSVAIGANGNVYAADNSTLLELNPTNGNVLRSLSGLSLANGVTPALDQKDIWVYTDTNTQIYDLATLALVQTLPGSRGSLNSAYDGPGAIFDHGFALDYGNIYGSPGFDVYQAAAAVPEPSSLVLAAVGVAGLLAVRWRSRRTRHV